MTPALYLLFALSAPVPKGGKPEIDFRVQPAATKLHLGDPLLVCVTLENNSKEAIETKGGFDFSGNALHFEVCPPDADKFHPFLALGQGGAFILPGVNGWPKVAVGEKVRCFGLLYYAFQEEDGPAFPAPGVWQVRAAFQTAGGRLTSEAVKVEVRKRDGKEAETVKGITPLLASALQSRGHLREVQENKLKAAAEEFGASRVTAAVARLVMWRDLRHAKTPDEVARAVAAYQAVREEAEGIEREYLDLETAQILLTLKELDRAEQIIDAVPEPSVELKNLKARLDGIRPRVRK